MTSRGRLKVEQRSWHWRWYNEWRLNKGMFKTQRSQVDLCHYMRVLLIFGPWRWFWQSTRWLDLEPFIWVILLALLGGTVFSFVTWPSGSLFVLGALALVLLVAAALLGVGYSIRRWYIKDTEAADAFIDRVVERIQKFSYYAFFPIWWPMYWLARGVIVVGLVIGEGVLRAGEYLFTKRLFSFTFEDNLITVVPMGLILPAGVLFAIVWNFVRHPVVALISLGAIIGAVMLVFVVVLMVQRIKRWAKENAAEQDHRLKTTPPAPKKEPSIFWIWLVAKKHRVCPLIEPQGGEKKI